MSTEPTPSSNSLHLPFALLAVAIAVLLASQIGANGTSTKIMKWQSENLTKQIEAYKEADRQAAEAIKNREGLVKQSSETQTQFQSLLVELLDLSTTDKDAEAIVKKYGVQRPATPAPAAGATPAPAAAPAATPAPR